MATNSLTNRCELSETPKGESHQGSVNGWGRPLNYCSRPMNDHRVAKQLATLKFHNPILTNADIVGRAGAIHHPDIAS